MRMAGAWGVTVPDDIVRLERLIMRHPESMRRIELFVQLLFDPSDRPLWFQGIDGAMPSPVDCIRGDGEGLADIEARLAALFTESAPPELFETGRSEPTNNEICESIVSRVMVMRAASPKRWSFVDPLTMRRHRSPSRAIATALQACARRSDRAETRALIRAALGDPERTIRRAAVAAAGRFLGYPAMRLALAELHQDPDPKVRLGLIEQYGTLSDLPEIRTMLLDFVRDSDTRVRLGAMTWLVRRKLNRDELEQIVPCCFDPHAPIARLARSCVPVDFLRQDFARRAKFASDGEPVPAADLYVLARSDAVGPQARAAVFAARLDILGRTERVGELAQTIRAIGFWDGTVPDSLWAAMARLVDGSKPLARDIERNLLLTIGHAGGAGAWPALLALLDHPEVGQSDALEERLSACLSAAIEQRPEAYDVLLARSADLGRLPVVRRAASRALLRTEKGREAVARIIAAEPSESPLRRLDSLLAGA